MAGLLGALLLNVIPVVSAQELKREFDAVPFTEVQVSDQFWAPRIDANRQVAVPHNIDWCENQTGRINNFKIASGVMQGDFSGIFFDDSDVYKILEGFAYTLASHPDPELQAKADEWIRYIAGTQEDDGYLMCYFKLVKPDEKWTNLGAMHELYCAGHMSEAAVAYARATGDETFLKVNQRLMDLICRRYGPNPGQLINVAGHEEIELALVKLFQYTGDKKYLEEAKFFVDARGVAEGREKGLFGEYCQDYKPVREQTEIVGHAVRAMYLYSGATDVAGYYQDKPLQDAMNRLWNNVTHRKMYITGGIGSEASNEGFGKEFYLPNQSAYCETCAAIGLVLWAHRMNLSTGDARFVDVMERAMYNGMISGYGLNGDSYFYVNPLASDGNHHRQPFFGCACCPSNVIRIVASLPGYIYATGQSDERKAAGHSGDDTVIVNMFVQGKATIELADQFVDIEQVTNYPWDGNVKIITKSRVKEGVDPNKVKLFTKVRIPGWCQRTRNLNGTDEAFHNVDAASLAKGYDVTEQKPNATNVDIREFEMPVVRMTAHPGVEADYGRVALQRGPIVYCFEQCDNADPVTRIILPKNIEFDPRTITVSSEKDNDATRNSLSRTVTALVGKEINGKTITAVPYCVWDNRQEGKMEVWVRQAGLVENIENADMTAWTDSEGEPILYQPLRESILTDDVPEIQDADFSGSFLKDALSKFDGSYPNVQPKGSNDQMVPRATWWNHLGTAEWFQYEYPQPKTVSKTTVYWFDDTGVGACRVPKSWKVTYQAPNSDQWNDVVTGDTYATDPDQEHVIHFEPVEVSKIRIEVQLQDNFSGGILKWNVEK